MKVVLVRPNHRSLGHIIMPPLGIGYLAGYLKAGGIKITIIDGLRDNLSLEALVQQILSERPGLVGISCYSSYYYEAIALSRKIKERNITCVIGGPHPTFMPYDTLLDSGCDYVIRGEAEIALLQLVRNNLVNNHIRGIYSLNNLSSSHDHVEMAEVIPDLDLIPFPDWESMNLNLYPKAPHGFFNKNYPAGIIISTRGCRYNCSFCASPKFYGSNIRYRSPENVVQEIKHLADNFKIKEIHFFDDNLTFDREHVTRIAQLIIENRIKINWSIPNGIRADSIDGGLLRLMKRSGCYYLAFGIESANPGILKNIHKGESIDQIRRAIVLAHKEGVLTGGLFIFGLPGETEETIQETIDFAARSSLIKADFFILDVLPGSALWDGLQGKFKPDWRKVSYREPEFLPEGLSRVQLMNSTKMAFRRFYFRPRRLLAILRLLKLRDFKFILNKLSEYRLT